MTASAATHMVTTAADELDTPSLAGTGQRSLREAVRDAAAGDTVLSSIPVMTLTRGEIVIERDLVIAAAPGSASVAVSGAHASRVFSVANGAAVTLARLVIEHGNGAGGQLGGYGGGIFNSGSLTLYSCTVRSNTATIDGGGISSSGNLTLEDCSVLANEAAQGGGISALGPVTLNRCTIADNQATARGGGCYQGNFGVQPLVADSSTFTGNLTQGPGGAVYLDSRGAFTHCTLARNTAGASGGGIHSTVELTLESCTLAENGASGRAGGLFHAGPNPGSLILKNTMLHKNTGSQERDLAVDGSNSLSLVGANFFTANTGLEGRLPAGNPNGAGQYVGISTWQLGALGYYGGANVQTMPPAAIANSSILDKAGPTTLGRDQRGFQRVVNGAADIGAAELIHLVQSNVTVANSALDLFPASGLAQADQPGDALGTPYYSLWYRYEVAPTSDFTDETYAAGLQMFKTARPTHLLVGNGAGAWAYSAEFASAGSVDLNSKTPESGAPYEFVRRNAPRTIVFRVDYRSGADHVTAWLNPDLSKPADLRTSFEADASFDALRAFHTGGGGGWTFQSVTVSEHSPFPGAFPLGENSTGPVIAGAGTDNFWYRIDVTQRGVLNLASTSGTRTSGQLFDTDGRTLRVSNLQNGQPDFSLSYDVEAGPYYLQVLSPTAAGHSVTSALLPPVDRAPLEIRWISSSDSSTIVSLTWATVPGATYEIYSSTDLQTWTFLLSRPSTQNSITVIGPPGNLFYWIKKL